MARPTKLTEDTQTRIVQAITMGATYELAAQYGGVAYNTFNEWLKKGNNGNGDGTNTKRYQEFYEAVKKAEGNAVVGWLAKIEKAANEGNWQAAAWKLEPRYPQDYGRRVIEAQGKDGGAIPIAVVPVDYRHAIDSLKPDDSGEDT